MKKVISIVLSVAMIITACVSMTGCGTNDTVENLEGTYTQEYAGTTLNVFNWGQYISDGAEGSLDVNAAFEKLTGIKVNYSTYESNEAMYGKMKSGAVAYDIIIPSDYMIQRMANEGMLREIDTSKLSNYHYIADKYKGLYFDPDNKYSVAYSVGMVGLIYNTTLVDEKPTSWKIMWDEKYTGNVLTFNNPRDAFAISQFALGIDLNTTNTADWDRAADYLKQQNKVLQGRVMDEVFNKMESANAAIAPYYAGDYLTMAEENEDLAFVYPEEGTNIFVDSICIPANCQNYEAALMYINFLLEVEVALANAEYICYATPNTGVLACEDYSLKDSEVLYPAVEPKTQYFHDLPADVRSYFENLWNQVILAD